LPVGQFHLQQVQRYRINIRAIAGNGRADATKSVLDCSALSGEELAEGGGRAIVGNRGRGGGAGAVNIQAITLASALVGREEEKFIVKDGTTQVEAELVLFQNRARLAGGVAEECIGVEVFIAEEFPRRAMEIVGAALGDDVNIRAGVPAVSGVVLAGLYFKFRDRVWIGDGNAAAKKAAALEIVDATPFICTLLSAWVPPLEEIGTPPIPRLPRPIAPASLTSAATPGLRETI